MWDFVKKPIDDHATFYAPLRVEDEDDLLDPRSIESLLHKNVAFTDVPCCEEKSPLDQALKDVKYDPRSKNVSSASYTFEGVFKDRVQERRKGK